MWAYCTTPPQPIDPDAVVGLIAKFNAPVNIQIVFFIHSLKGSSTNKRAIIDPAVKVPARAAALLLRCPNGVTSPHEQRGDRGL